MDTGQKTESLAQLVDDVDKNSVALPEFQRDFVWDVEKTYDLFDSFIRDIFVGSLIYGVPSFEITVRELDTRPRTGKGSRRKLTLASYSKADIDKLVKTSGFRLLLDGQQRATSIFRALKGIDPVYFLLATNDDLPPEVREKPVSKRLLEECLFEIRGEPLPGRVCIGIQDVYRMLKGEISRERDKAEVFLSCCQLGIRTTEEALESGQFEEYLTQAKNLENLLRQEKLVAYYLLDTDEEKFALFFERSNSKGIQLNFIDILAAKLYVGFNLRSEVDRFEEGNPDLTLNREALVRALSYAISGGKDTGRAYILSNLTHVHFSEHWSTFTNLYRQAYNYLAVNRLLIHPAWIPYENMTIPLMLVLRHLPHHDFSQLSELQSKIIRTWYWLAILSRRYSSAAQTYILEDAQVLEKVAQGDVSAVPGLFRKMKPQISKSEDLFGVYKKYDALYKGILNLINYDRGGLVSWISGEPVSWNSNLEDHHIFPRDFLRKTIDKSSMDSTISIDCVVNRTLIPKLTNLKATNKAPSVYLAEMAKKNSDLRTAIENHLLPADLMKGAYDDLYEIFLEDRAKLILTAMETNVFKPSREILATIDSA